MGERPIQTVDPALIATAMQSLAEGVMIVDRDGRIIYVNRAFAEGLGVPAEEVIGRRWDDPLLRVTDLEGRPIPREQRAFGRVLATGKPLLGYDYLVYNVSGRALRVLVNAVPVPGPDGIIGVAVTMTDITDRVKAEEKVRFQSSLLDQVRNAVIGSDAQRRINYVNKSAELLFGWEPGEALGKDVLEFAAPSSTEPQYGSPVETIQREGRWEGEATIRRRDGVEVPVLLSIGTVMGNNGEPIGIIGVATDLTDIKAAQRALEEKDRAIRQAYVDVVSSVTGGKFVIMTEQELVAALGEPVTEVIGIEYETLSDTRRRVFDAMEEMGTSADPSEAIVAYSEAATNALKHAGRGRCQVFRKDGMLQVLVSDEGGGIDFELLPRAAVTPGFSTKQTLGMGFTIMLDLSDRLLLATRPGCTEVVLEFGLRRAGERRKQGAVTTADEGSGT